MTTTTHNPSLITIRESDMSMCPDYKKIGIIGGMGPLAGVLTQELLIAATPAERDQDHLSTIYLGLSDVPDRTIALQDPAIATNYLAMMSKAISHLNTLDVDAIVITCNTAHAFWDVLQPQSGVPMINLVELTKKFVASTYPRDRVGLLATSGTIDSGIYHNNSTINWVLPADQQQITDIIRHIKTGNYNHVVKPMQATLSDMSIRGGATAVVLGCTELSLLYNCCTTRMTLIDPLRILANYLCHQPLDQPIASVMHLPIHINSFLRTT